MGIAVRYAARETDEFPFGGQLWILKGVICTPGIEVEDVESENCAVHADAPWVFEGARSADEGRRQVCVGAPRLVCATSGDWDLWVHAMYEDPEDLSPRSSWEPILRVALVNRREGRLWFLGLQGLPDACDHPADVLPPQPCRPLVEAGGAYAMFAIPERRNSGDLWPYCPLDVGCRPCCPPADGRYECWPRPIRRCDANAAWFDAACAAQTIDEIPPAPMLPCDPADPHDGTWACGYAWDPRVPDSWCP